MKSKLECILLWGSLWGLEEATLGHFLHLFPFSIGWLFWFPLAYLFMHTVYTKTGKLTSILYTASLASVIKLTDLFLPIRIDMVLNPAVSILLEGCAVYLTFWMIQKHPSLNRFKLVNALSASILSQLFYIIYILIIPNFILAIPPMTNSNAYLNYGLHCVINGLTIFLFLKYYSKISNTFSRKLKISSDMPPAIKTFISVISYVLPVLTVFVQWAM
ncbi:hypothetical protein [Caproiciproducens sp.]|uniref:hypothetical protein n=1 Tax=Caproiciproducens sp. TaxID=1954376 RepID=UPI00289D7565|nr:hypothetical protein [Caproiciproducens sp.]